MACATAWESQNPHVWTTGSECKRSVNWAAARLSLRSSFALSNWSGRRFSSLRALPDEAGRYEVNASTSHTAVGRRGGSIDPF